MAKNDDKLTEKLHLLAGYDKGMSMMSETGREVYLRHAIPTAASCREALAMLNSLSGGSMTLFAIAPDGTMVGTLTDGDVRRSLLRGATLDSEVSDVMHSGFTALTPDADEWTIFRTAREKGIDLLPRLGNNGMITEVVDLRHLKSLLPIDAVLMAGGRGERLRPLTDTTPKPLLKIGGKAIIDYNIEALRVNGVGRIYATVNYLKEQIIEHFSTDAAAERVRCVAEPERLGTIGSLSLIDDFVHDDILVMNSDLLTTLNFADMYERHRSSGAAVTMAVVPYAVSVPFAIVRTKGDSVMGLEEKPVYNYLANAGVYIIKKDLVARIKRGSYLDAPDFVEEVIADGLKVSYYMIDGTWIDIGSPEDFRNADLMMTRSAKE